MIRLRIPGVGRQSANQEFLEEIADRGAPNTNQRVFESQLHSITVASWIVEIGNSAGGQASQDAGIIRLPAAGVTLANDRIRHRVQNGRSRTAGAFIEIPWVLFEERRQDRAPDHVANEAIRKGCAVPLGIPLRA